LKRIQFIEYLRHPENLNEQSLSGLREVVDEYPYFQAARMLFIKNLHLLDHISLNNELKIAAAHISDRKKLYILLNNYNFSETNERFPLEEKPEIIQKTDTDLLDYERGDTQYDLSYLYKEEQTSKNEKMSLIDRFLQKQNIEKIKIIESGDYEIEDFSIKSLEENDELMTETLADIFIKQKLFLKAKNIFEKLCLKFPEKSIYFAARIKEVEKLVNNLN